MNIQPSANMIKTEKIWNEISEIITKFQIRQCLLMPRHNTLYDTKLLHQILGLKYNYIWKEICESNEAGDVHAIEGLYNQYMRKFEDEDMEFYKNNYEQGAIINIVDDMYRNYTVEQLKDLKIEESIVKNPIFENILKDDSIPICMARNMIFLFEQKIKDDLRLKTITNHAPTNAREPQQSEQFFKEINADIAKMISLSKTKFNIVSVPITNQTPLVVAEPPVPKLQYLNKSPLCRKYLNGNVIDTGGRRPNEGRFSFYAEPSYREESNDIYYDVSNDEMSKINKEINDKENDLTIEAARLFHTSIAFHIDFYLHNILVYNKKNNCYHLFDIYKGIWETLHEEDFTASIFSEYVILIKYKMLHAEWLMNNLKDGTDIKEKNLLEVQYKYRFDLWKKMQAVTFEANVMKKLKTLLIDKDVDTYMGKIPPHIFPLKDGRILNLKTGKSRVPKLTDFCNYKGVVHHKPDLGTKIIDNFMDDMFLRDIQTIELMRAVLGYCITGETSAKLFFLLENPAGSGGKSTLIHMLQCLLGDDLARTAEKTLVVKGKRGNDESPKPFTALLKGKRMALLSELDVEDEFNSSEIKRFSGGTDKTSARKLQSNDNSFLPICKIFVVYNNMPICPENDKAFYKRMIRFIIECEFIPIEEYDPTNPKHRIMDFDAPTKLTTPDALSQLLNWCLIGSMRWYELTSRNVKAIVRTPKMQINHNFLIKQSENVDLFAEDMCIIEERERIRGSELYDCYKKWAKELGLRISSQKSFYAKIVRDGIRRTTINGINTFCGIMPKNYDSLFHPEGQPIIIS